MCEKNALLILNAIPSLTNKKIYQLIDRYGSAQAVFNQSTAQFLQDGILTQRMADDLEKFDVSRFIEEELSLIDKEAVTVVFRDDDLYPSQLKQINDAPLLFYVKGVLPDTLDISIAIVGSRIASLYGLSVAEQFAFKMAQYNIPVISGLAKGIDAAAHRGALRARGKTVGVLGCGLMEVYPKENAQLFKSIPESGAIISEFPMRMTPVPYNFPRRNRIVSGISRGVVVVEAAKKSGALITADFALEQGRDVYAVPGKIDNPSAGGVNDLIRQGAKIILSVDDILEDIAANVSALAHCRNFSNESVKNENNLENLTEEEKIVYNQITDQPAHIDAILSKCIEGGVRCASAVLLKLEMKSLIKQLPGKRFKR